MTSQAEIVGKLEEINRAVLLGESTDWALVADQLASAARLCRTQVVTELTDIGDSGGR